MPELSVHKVPVGKLFSEMQGKKFIIPNFQRRYSWDVEKCETLWQDVINFLVSAESEDTEYFLGTIVSNDGENGNQEVIDGQQRITTLLLVLRAFYSKLENMSQADKAVLGLKSDIEPCIWDIDRKTKEIKDMANIRLNSHVVTEDESTIFHKILEMGDCYGDSKNNYNLNFAYFREACDEYAEQNPLQWKDLCVTFLDKCIILPINCNSQETALTIFATLNDRGMPLDDSDIFKAQIYKNQPTEQDRNNFTEQWKELSQICISAGIKINDIFRYYSHVIRAKKQDNSKEIGLRRFYAEKNYALLTDKNIMADLSKLADFWLALNTHSQPNESYIISDESRKFVHCLAYYPNEYWKYLVSVYFMKNCQSQNFEHEFTKLLKKVTAFMFAKFLVAPTVNQVKMDIFNACIAIYQNADFWIDAKLQVDKDKFYSSAKISKALLLLHAYLNPKQMGVLPQDFQVEHILPRKWQNTNYNGWTQEQAAKYLETFGNKVVIERKLNIQAGNGYFGRKKERYAESQIADVRDLINIDDFNIENIKARENAFQAKLLDFFVEQGVC
ncbi:MAG: DUF262 domain-containing HNH endonuclease family protein [Firmicutes bacterium]|nr:DUF262 domain-containing HNH endonuclease family protein [Bacillota bacterium]